MLAPKGWESRTVHPVKTSFENTGKKKHFQTNVRRDHHQQNLLKESSLVSERSLLILREQIYVTTLVLRSIRSDFYRRWSPPLTQPIFCWFPCAQSYLDRLGAFLLSLLFSHCWTHTGSSWQVVLCLSRMGSLHQMLEIRFRPDISKSQIRGTAWAPNKARQKVLLSWHKKEETNDLCFPTSPIFIPIHSSSVCSSPFGIWATLIALTGKEKGKQ